MNPHITLTMVGRVAETYELNYNLDLDADGYCFMGSVDMPAMNEFVVFKLAKYSENGCALLREMEAINKAGYAHIQGRYLGMDGGTYRGKGVMQMFVTVDEWRPATAEELRQARAESRAA